MTTFPSTLDTFPDEATLRSRDLDDATLDHPAYDALINSAVRALEEKIGIDGSGVTTSLDYRANVFDAHIVDTIGAHEASAITLDPTGLSNTSATDLQQMAVDFDNAISTSGISPGVLTAAGSLITSGIGPGFDPTELLIGAANTVLGVDAAGTALAYRDAYALPQSIDTTQVESFTVALDQVGQWVRCEADDATARVITLPQDSDVAVPIGTTVTFEIVDALAAWTWSAGTGATILDEEHRSGDPEATGQGAVVYAFKVAANTWRVTGSVVLDTLGFSSDLTGYVQLGPGDHTITTSGARHVVEIAGTYTFETGSDLIGTRLFIADPTIIVDTVANLLFGEIRPFVNSVTYQSKAGDNTNRNLQDMQGFRDAPIIIADTSDDTMYMVHSHVAAPSFQRTGGGTLVLDLMTGFFVAGAGTFQSGITVTDRHGFLMEDFAAGGTVVNNYGISLPRLTRGSTLNLGIDCASSIRLWNDTYTFTANPLHVLQWTGTQTMGAGSDVPPAALNTSNTLIVDVALNVFAAPSIFRAGGIYKSAANSTVRDLKQMRVFTDGQTVQADTSADTMANYMSFHSAPTFSRVNSGTLALTDAQQFYAAAAAVGAGVTITTLRGVRIDDASGSGTVTNAYGLQIATIAKGATKNRAIQINKGGIEFATQETAHDGTSKLAASAASVYIKANNLVFAYNDGGTMRYLYIPLTGTGTAFSHDTTGP